MEEITKAILIITACGLFFITGYFWGEKNEIKRWLQEVRAMEDAYNKVKYEYDKLESKYNKLKEKLNEEN